MQLVNVIKAHPINVCLACALPHTSALLNPSEGTGIQPIRDRHLDAWLEVCRIAQSVQPRLNVITRMERDGIQPHREHTTPTPTRPEDSTQTSTRTRTTKNRTHTPRHRTTQPQKTQSTHPPRPKARTGHTLHHVQERNTPTK
jgi:hypothetical protein